MSNYWTDEAAVQRLRGTLGGPVSNVGGVTISGTPSVGYVPTATSATAATWQAAPAPAGVPVVHYFAFAFNTASLAAGVTFFTPTVGDIFLDSWVEVTTAWNGTTPFCDYGPSTGYQVGAGANAQDMTANDGANAVPGLLVGTLTSSFPTFNESAYMNAAAQVRRLAPGRFTAATPWKVWVTQDGLMGGAAPGGNAGTARVYIKTATPVAL